MDSLEKIQKKIQNISKIDVPIEKIIEVRQKMMNELFTSEDFEPMQVLLHILVEALSEAYNNNDVDKMIQYQSAIQQIGQLMLNLKNIELNIDNVKKSSSKEPLSSYI